jgi:very-short-patch-repair endonuclease
MDHKHKDYPNPTILARARELRQPQTPAEAKLWQRLRNRQIGGHKFRRQHPIDRFIVDFYCDERKLVIEIDGDSHTDQVEYDALRTEWLNRHGYRVVRFTNDDVMKRFDGVLETILAKCEEA